MKEKIQADLAYLRRWVRVWSIVDKFLMSTSIIAGITATILSAVAGTSNGPQNPPNANAVVQKTSKTADEITDAFGGWRSTCYIAMLSAGIATGSTAMQRGLKTSDKVDQANACKGKLRNLELILEKNPDSQEIIQEYERINSEYASFLP